MSSLLDEMAADEPVRDVAVNLSRLTDAPAAHPVRMRQDVAYLPREELEDRFLRQYEEMLLLKQQTQNQNNKIRKLGTKLMCLVKDRRRMEQLAAGDAPPPSRIRDVELEEMVDDLQEKVRSLQAEKEELRRRLLVAKQQLLIAQRASPYGHVQPRVHSGPKKLREGAMSPLARPKSSRSLEGGARPPPGQLPRYGHSLLEEARAQIVNLENVIESQRRHLEEVEGVSELLREELKKKEAECEEHLLEVRQRTTTTLRSQVSSNVTSIKLQKQLAERSHAVLELESRFLHLQQSQQALKASHGAAMLQADELSAQLKEERMKNVELEKHLQSSSISRIRMDQLLQQISELEQERDLLKDNNQKLVNSALDVSHQQRQQIQEQQLRLQVSQLEAALKADLLDKNQILDQIKAERETSQKLMEEKQKLQMQLVEQKQQLEELRSRDKEHDMDDLTEALLLIKRRKSQRSSDLSFLDQEEEQEEVRGLRAAHNETIQELEKTRNLLAVERRISGGYKAELEAALQKMAVDQSEQEQKLTHRAHLLETRGARIKKLEAQLRNRRYDWTALRPAPGGELVEDVGGAETLDSGECLVELQVVGATLSTSVQQNLAGDDVSTFCTYSFYLFQLHSTPVVAGVEPRYGFTSQYVVTVDRHFLNYLRHGVLTVELHRALGLDWRPLASGRIALRGLLEQEGGLHGSVDLQGLLEDSLFCGSLMFWIKTSPPMIETARLYGEQLQTASISSTSCITPTLTEPAQPPGWNELLISVVSCSGLRSCGSQQPNPYVVYKFWDFPDQPTDTVLDSAAPRFGDLRHFPVPMDAELHEHLRSEHLFFYVFDDKDLQVDAYLGKAGVALQPLLHGQTLAGRFPLCDPSGLPAGHIQVTLQWKMPYAPPSCSQDRILLPEDHQHPQVYSSPHSAAAAAQSNNRLKLPVKEEANNKKVTFKEPQLDSGTRPGAADEDQSHVSEGQLVTASDDSEISEDLSEGQQGHDLSEDANESDSDDCIILKHATGRKASERLRVEIVSLSLRAESRLSRDDAVVRLFVEYSFLDLPTEETPTSLPKPPPGRCINYNYSKVVPVDAENNMARRRLIRGVLQGRNPPMEQIRFTVVSEPPEEEEQERECEDVGVASLRMAELLERRRDLTEENLDVVSVEDGGELLGSLTVSFEALEAFQSIMADEQDVTPPCHNDTTTPGPVQLVGRHGFWSEACGFNSPVHIRSGL